LAWGPLKVRCSTSWTNFEACPSEDGELAVAHHDLQPAGREGADEDHLLGVLADVDEAAGAGQAGPKRDTLRLPCTSAWASPRKAMSSPPPS
jgi:hypothetical protein